MILHLPLKAVWYDMINGGGKREEYREITPYWCKRLMWRMLPDADGAIEPCLLTEQVCIAMSEHLAWLHDAIQQHKLAFRDFTVVHFSRGYPKRGDDTRRMVWPIKEIKIGTGRPEWGAIPGKEYFIIRLEE